MTAVVSSNSRFDDLILEEEISFAGKTWCSYLLVPQEHLQDLFASQTCIPPHEAYDRAPEFWNKASEATGDLYLRYLSAQNANPLGAIRRQWFQWKDFDRLAEAFETFKRRSNEPVRLSVIARPPPMAMAH